jgi:hypothetical protein
MEVGTIGRERAGEGNYFEVTFTDERYLLVSWPDNCSGETSCTGNNEAGLKVITSGKSLQLLSQVCPGDSRSANIHT